MELCRAMLKDNNTVWYDHFSCKQQTALNWNIFWAKVHTKRCKYGDYSYHTSEQSLHSFSTSERLQSQSRTNLHLVLVSLILNGNKGYIRRCKLRGPKHAMKILNPRKCIPCAKQLHYYELPTTKNCERNNRPPYSTSMVSDASKGQYQFSLLIARLCLWS